MVTLVRERAIRRGRARRTVFLVRFGVLVSLAASGVGCTDVGDSGSSSALDGGVPFEGTTGDDGSVPVEENAAPPSDAEGGLDAGPDSTVLASGDAAVDAPSTPADTGVEGSAAAFDGSAIGEGGPEASLPEAGIPEAGIPEAGIPDGATGGTKLPCTTPGQTNCVQCDQSANGVCTQTEAIIVQRDIEKGLVSGNVPAPSMGNADGSCYECLVTNFVIDGSGMGSGSECDDLTTGVQVCLDTLNCIMGSPQSGTAGANGGAASLQSACANAPSTAPSGQPVDGVFNCFCGTAEPNASACKASPAISSGMAGVPNGTCRDVSLAGTNDNATTTTATIISDLSGINTPSGKAYKILTGAGTNGTPTDAACSQCYK